VNQPRCTGITKSGAACRSFALPNRAYCVMHDPELADKVAAARARGGTAAARLRVLTGRRLRLDTPASVVRFAAGVVQDTLAGTVDPEIAKTVLYGLNVQLKAVEMAEQSEGRRLMAEVRRLRDQARRT
jgi:hypothetical protein